VFSSLLNAVFGWIDRPWKAVAFAVVGMFAAMLFGLWSERPVLIEILRERINDPELDLERADEILPVLAGYADIVVLWEVDPGRNYREVVRTYGGTDDQREVIATRVEPYVAPNRDAGSLISEIEGETVCMMQTAYAGLPYTYTCTHKVPAHRPGVVGLVTVAWIDKPIDEHLSRARAALRYSAEGMAKW